MKTILVPLDGSRLAERALPYATALARAVQGRLLLVWAVPGELPERVDHAATQLAASAGKLRAAGLTVDQQVSTDQPVPAITHLARDQADLIVMSTHGRSGLGRWLYGSVADRVLHHASVPVFLVPAVSEPIALLDIPAERRRVLVPLDGSELAEAALGPAGELAEALAAELLLLRVVVPPDESGLALAQIDIGLAGPLSYPPSDFDEAAAQAAAQRYLDAIAAEQRAEGRRASTQVEVCVPLVPVASTIADAAQASGSQAFALATHGRGGLDRLIMGSVATELIHRAKLPLLLVGPAALPASATAPAPRSQEAASSDS